MEDRHTSINCEEVGRLSQLLRSYMNKGKAVASPDQKQMQNKGRGKRAVNKLCLLSHFPSLNSLGSRLLSDVEN